MKLHRFIFLITISILLIPSPTYAKKKDKIKLGIKTEFDYIRSPYAWDKSKVYPPSQLRLGGFGIKFKYKIDEVLKFQADFKYKDDDEESIIKRVFIDYKNILNLFDLHIGKDKALFAFSDDTNAGLLPSIYMADYENVGFRVSKSFSNFSLIGDISNGIKLKQNEISDHEIYNSLVDDGDTTDTDQGKRYGIGIEYKNKNREKEYKTKAGIYYYYQKLNSEDAILIDTLPGAGGQSSDRKYALTAINFSCIGKKLESKAQAIISKTGKLNRTSYGVSFAYKIKFNFIEELKLLTNYSIYKDNSTNTLVIPESWDRSLLTFGMLFNINDVTSVLFEYNNLGETTGAKSIDNDGILVKLSFEV